MLIILFAYRDERNEQNSQPGLPIKAIWKGIDTVINEIAVSSRKWDFFKCMWMFVCMYVCYVCAWCPWMPEEHVRSPGTSCRWFWPIMWIPGMRLQYPIGSAGAFSHWVISLGPRNSRYYFFQIVRKYWFKQMPFFAFIFCILFHSDLVKYSNTFSM